MTHGADQRATELVMGAYFDALLREDVPTVSPASDPDPAMLSAPSPAVARPSESPAFSATPALADGSYQMISVGGVTLGVPTAVIDGIAPYDGISCAGDVTSDCVLGCYTVDAATITVVDTARLLLPGQAAAPARGGFVLRLRDQPWALRCETVGATFTPAPEAIHWRGANGKRVWLAGTVREPACALLDIPGLLKLLPR